MYISFIRAKKDKKKVKVQKPPVVTPMSTARSSSDFTTVSDVTPRQPITGKSDVKPTRQQRQVSDQALQFRNDSGTQINFWGAPPTEVS